MQCPVNLSESGENDNEDVICVKGNLYFENNVLYSFFLISHFGF